MWLILVEMALALGLAIFIVWWTMFYRPKNETTSVETASPPSAEDDNKR